MLISTQLHLKVMVAFGPGEQMMTGNLAMEVVVELQLVLYRSEVILIGQWLKLELIIVWPLSLMGPSGSGEVEPMV